MNYHLEIEHSWGPEGPNVEQVYVCDYCYNYDEACECLSYPAIPQEPLLTPVEVEVFIPFEMYASDDPSLPFLYGGYRIEAMSEGMELIFDG